MGVALVFIQHVTKFRCVLFILGFIGRFVVLCLLVIATMIVGGLETLLAMVSQWLVFQGRRFVNAQGRAIEEHHEYHRRILEDDK